MGLMVGDKVVLRHNSPFNDGLCCNPIDCIGVVSVVDFAGGWNRVVWMNGYSNVYYESCLQVLGSTGMKTDEEVQEWRNAL